MLAIVQWKDYTGKLTMKSITLTLIILAQVPDDTNLDAVFLANETKDLRIHIGTGKELVIPTSFYTEDVGVDVPFYP